MNCSDGIAVGCESYTGSLSSHSYGKTTWFFPTLNVVCNYFLYENGNSCFNFFGKDKTVAEDIQSAIKDFITRNKR